MDAPQRIGRFDVLGVIGQGGMGSVYRARDPMLDRPVAIKLLREGFDSDEMRERFEREARAAGRLSHPNIVTIYEFGEFLRRPFIAMELVDGEPLSDWIRRREPASMARDLDLIEQLCSGLAHAHKAGIVHRDIKPSNLIIDRQARVLKILDFGIAKVSGSGLTHAGMIVGTVNYMSPEQITGGAVIDHRADIFAVGAVMFELLTHRKPFPGELADALYRIVHEPSPLLASILPGVDPAIERIVAQALEKAPDRRYQDLSTMRRDIARVRQRLELDDAAKADTHTVIRPRPVPGAAVPSGPGARPDASGSWVKPGGSTEDSRHTLEALRGDARARFEAGEHRAAIVRCDLVLRLAPGDQAATELRERARRALTSIDAPRPDATMVEKAPQTVFAEAPITAMQRLETIQRSEASPRPGPEADQSVFLRSPVAQDAAPSAVLVVTQTTDSLLLHKRIPVGLPTFVLGRGSACDLSLPDVAASRRHAVIEYVADDFVIRDGGSRNGTFLNGRRLAQDGEPLVVGATIRIGATVLTFAYGRDTALPDLTGGRVERRYRLESLIRQSTRSAVYAARDGNTQARVAIKLIAPALFRHPAYRRQFDREVEMVAQLDHPHICRVLDSYAEGEVQPADGPSLRAPVLCYALYDGGTLQDVIDGREPVPGDRIASWMQRVAEALQHAHDQHIVHGDLKPTAIVLDASRTHPYLTDFAIAHRLAGETGKPPVSGAPPFMAPEQWEGNPVSAAVDQFGLAAIAYYLVTGRRPFEGQENPVIRERNFERGAPDAHVEARRNERGEVSPGVSAVLRKALAQDPGARFESVRAFAQSLDAAFKGSLRNTTPRAFLSYRRESNTGWVWAFSNALKDRYGITSFMDIAPIDVAERFPGRLEEEIRACDVFVCFLSRDTLESDWVRREIALARKHHRPMVPVVDRAFVPSADRSDPAIAELLEYDFVQLHEDYVDAAIDRLAKRIKASHGGGAGAPPPRAKGGGSSGS